MSCEDLAGAAVPTSLNESKNQGRAIPDIAGKASTRSAYVIVVGGTRQIVGGTSAVAPLYAGLIALITASIGTRIGYLNPFLYSHRETDVFRDINDGDNNHWSNGPTATPSYVSGPGWNACTGLGIINGDALLRTMSQ